MTGGSAAGGATPRLAAALLLAGWLGSAILTVAVVTPSAFAVLPSRTLAGAMVGRVLPPLFLSGIGVSLAALAVAALDRAIRAAAVAATVGAFACGMAAFFINPRIARLRESIGGPVEALAAGDARRVAFGQLHGYSIGGLGVAMLASATALFVIVVAMRRAPGPARMPSTPPR